MSGVRAEDLKLGRIGGHHVEMRYVVARKHRMARAVATAEWWSRRHFAPSSRKYACGY
jgi:hypothetical protein